jgi:hypothetical protein
MLWQTGEQRQVTVTEVAHVQELAGHNRNALGRVDELESMTEAKKARRLRPEPRTLMRIRTAYSLAEAYELISQFKQISSNPGVVHSIISSLLWISEFHVSEDYFSVPAS